MAAGLVWTIGQDGKLYGLDPATGKTRLQASIGVPANHFPTPGVGDGLLLAACAQSVVAFSAPGTGGQHAATQTPRPSKSCNYSAPAPPVSGEGDRRYRGARGRGPRHHRGSGLVVVAAGKPLALATDPGTLSGSSSTRAASRSS